MNKNHQAIFLGGISITTTQEDIQDHFCKYGKIKEVTMKVDPKTGRRKPYAFLQFFDSEATNNAIQEEQNLGGRNIDCELSCFNDNVSK